MYICIYSIDTVFRNPHGVSRETLTFAASVTGVSRGRSTCNVFCTACCVAHIGKLTSDRSGASTTSTTSPGSHGDTLR